MHTIPIYSHALFVSELVFEGGHQPLKFSLSRSTNANSHIYATQLNLAKDWLVRIAHTFYIIKHGAADKKRSAYRSLLYLFGGTRTVSINWDLPELSFARREAEEFLLGSIDGLVYNFLEQWYGTGEDTFDMEGKWTGTDACDEMEQVTRTHAWLRHQLARLYGHGMDGSTKIDVQFYEKALFYRTGEVNAPPRYKHHVIRPGDSVEMIMDNTRSSKEFVKPSSTGNETRLRVRIEAIASLCGSHVQTEHVYACVTRYEQVDMHGYHLFRLDPHTEDM